jgi:hypothetical protein
MSPISPTYDVMSHVDWATTKNSRIHYYRFVVVVDELQPRAKVRGLGAFNPKRFLMFL